MAACIQFTCSSCGFSVQAWDEGNPYIQFPGLRKPHYFYHPSGERMVLARLFHTRTDFSIFSCKGWG